MRAETRVPKPGESEARAENASGAGLPRPPASVLDPAMATVDDLPVTADSLPTGMGFPEIHRVPKRERTTAVTRRAPSAGPLKPCLLVLSGPQEGQAFWMKVGQEAIIGRSEKCDVVLTDDGISRQHARLRIRGEQLADVEDLGSRNGTFVGDARIKAQEVSGEVLIRLGGATAMKFGWLDEAEEAHRRRLVAAALKDGLTGLYNRRHFDEALMAEIAGARRHGTPLALAIADIDNFKQVNDTRGHPAGDATIKMVGEALLSCARREDLVFRLGGEEFALLMRDTDLTGAMRLCERARKRVERTRLRSSGDKPDLQVTVSLGVAQLDPGEADSAFVARADRALYRAKTAGKNRSELAD